MSVEDPVAPAAPSVMVPGAVALPSADLYDQSIDPRQALTPEQIEQLKQNRLKSFSPGGAVALAVVTLGIFPFIYYLLKHDQLPKVKENDPSAGKAIGFSFIPYFNIFYWTWFVWVRLVNRINFQFRLRGQEAPLSKGVTIVSILIAPVALYQIYKAQKGINALAAERGA